MDWNTWTDARNILVMRLDNIGDTGDQGQSAPSPFDITSQPQHAAPAMPLLAPTIWNA